MVKPIAGFAFWIAIVTATLAASSGVAGVRSRHRSFRLPRGSTILRAFAIPGRDDLLVYVFRHGKLRLLVTDGRTMRPASIAWSSRAESVDFCTWVDAVDFEHKFIYDSLPNHGGNYLSRQTFDGKKEDILGEPGMLDKTFVKQGTDLVYRILFPPDMDRAYPKAYLALMRGAQVVKQIPIGYDPVNACYCRRTDTLYLVYLESMRTLAGKVIRLPNSHHDDAEPRPIDVDPAGCYAYYADPYDHLLYKIRLEDGHVSRTRRLTMPVDGVTVAGSGRFIYLVNSDKRTIAKIARF